jgi:hypothetical protein
MSRQHELGHHLLAAALGLNHSPTMMALARGTVWPRWRIEEAAVLALQAYSRAVGADLVALIEGDAP